MRFIGPKRPCRKSGRGAAGLLNRTPRNPGRFNVHLIDAMFQVKIGLGDGLGVKRIGLDDVAPLQDEAWTDPISAGCVRLSTSALFFRSM